MQPFRPLTKAFDHAVRFPWRERKARRCFEGGAWDVASNDRYTWHLAETYPGATRWKDKRRSTLLHFAAAVKDTELCGFLLKQGAAIDAADKHARTPLHLAATARASETCALLVEKGADINAPDEQGFTPLHMAAQCAGDGTPEDRAAPLKALLKGHADLEARNKDGETPLMFAINRNKPWNVTALVLAGADVSAKSNAGASPLSEMEKYRFHETSVALKSAMEELAGRAEEVAWLAQQASKQRVIDEAVTAVKEGLACDVTVARPVRLKK